MGFGGVVAAMITSLKNNDRRKQRTQFDKDKAGGYGNGEKVEFDFPEVTPQVLRSIRDRLQQERKQLVRKRLVVFSCLLTILIVLFIAMML